VFKGGPTGTTHVSGAYAHYHWHIHTSLYVV
jgi:hypothetical protein